MSPWFRVAKEGFANLGYKILAPFYVPFLSPSERVTHPIFGIADATDLGYWNVAWRNGAWNYGRRPMVEFDTFPVDIEDPSMENVSGFQWRYRVSKDKQFVSLRVVAGKARSKGKFEFYIGDTMNERKTMGVTFFQLRLPWWMWVGGAAAISWGILK